MESNIRVLRAKNDNVGKKILQTLIEKRPKFAEYFGIQTVGSLGFCPISSVYDMAHRIGQIHFYRGVNFGADNWLVFKRVTVDQVTTGKTDCSTDPEQNGLIKIETENDTIIVPDLANPYSGENCLARLGWNKLMTVIVREMKRGFLEEAMRNCKEEDNNGLLG
ncbi:unnamed protein product [Strongylus vulgaris]|uniref:Uncharacterized protein n=1 Tax=Strongylus vulgaris TaxID=40348 RepID=A0A3P7J377_STRVU|nr:unnamed protein product [Strongylus vulgaris]